MFLIYNTVTGEIQRILHCTFYSLDINVGDTEGVLLVEEMVDSEENYVDVTSKKVTPKFDFNLEALPLPCVVEIEGTAYPCTSQPVISFDSPGRYNLKVYAGVRYLEKEFTIEN